VYKKAISYPQPTTPALPNTVTNSTKETPKKFRRKITGVEMGAWVKH
jgi:hypothetical protein